MQGSLISYSQVPLEPLPELPESTKALENEKRIQHPGLMIGLQTTDLLGGRHNISCLKVHFNFKDPLVPRVFGNGSIGFVLFSCVEERLRGMAARCGIPSQKHLYAFSEAPCSPPLSPWGCWHWSQACWGPGGWHHLQWGWWIIFCTPMASDTENILPTQLMQR